MQTVQLILIAVPLTLFAGCVDEQPCDPDQTYDHGLCYVEATAPDGGIDGNFAHFGDVCAADADCTAPTTYCAKQPGQTMGYCTRTGCIEDASICPAMWTCLDLSVFQPGLPSMCKRP